MPERGRADMSFLRHAGVWAIAVNAVCVAVAILLFTGGGSPIFAIGICALVALNVALLYRRWRDARKARYRAVIVGRESGQRHALDFVTFATVGEAGAWCTRMNDAHNLVSDLTYYSWETIRD